MFEIIRRDPFNLRTMRDMMESVANDPFFRMPSMRLDENGGLAVDVLEGENEIIVRASLPGYKKEDVDVIIQNGVLTINAEHTEEKETKDEKFYRRERQYGSMSRQITLPGIVSEGKADAELKDGVLTIRIPHAEEAKPKKLTIKS